MLVKELCLIKPQFLTEPVASTWESGSESGVLVKLLSEPDGWIAFNSMEISSRWSGGISTQCTLLSWRIISASSSVK